MLHSPLSRRLMKTHVHLYSLLFLLALLLAEPQAATAQSSTIAVKINNSHHPINPMASRGDVLDVEVIVGTSGNPVTDLFAVGFEVHYDPAQLAFDTLSVTPGPFLPAGTLETYVENDSLAGIASLSVSPLGNGGGVTGFGTVLSFAFHVRADAPPGPSGITLADSLAITGEGVPIDLVAQAGSIEIFEAIVWPGDTDPSDCEVNQNDLLPLGLAWHQEGEARGLNLIWEAQGATNWATASANEVNDAHVDATGDGRVSQNDLLPIGLNFGLTRDGCTAAAAKTLYTTTLALPPLEAGANATVLLQVDQGVDALLGVGFELAVPSESVRITTVKAGALLDDGDLLAIDRYDVATGTLAAAFTRKGTRTPASGTGTLVEIELEALRHHHEPTVLTLSNLKLSDVHGHEANASALALVMASAVATANEDFAAVPTHFRLHGAYPNPFNPSTTISYDLPEAAEVTLLVYDMLGREVQQTLVGHQAAGANHQVSFEAQGLASGTYLYRVVAQLADRQEMKTGRFVLMK